MMTLNIGLAPWVIADGNYEYSDFRRSGKVEFAVRFHPLSIDKTQEKQRTIRPLGDCLYEVTAEVVYHSPKAWIIDFGTCAYNELSTPTLKTGDFISAQIYLGIDPFFYFEQLWKLPEMIPLIYAWRVDTTIRRGAPLVQKGDGNRWCEADASKYAYDEVDFTAPPKIVSEAESIERYRTTSVDFILRCERIAQEAKFRRS